MSHTNRIILLIDMDCFYCQVEENLNPILKGKPIAVVQYNQWRGGGIIAVNYPARDQGVTRHMRGNDAKEKCPNIALVKVPDVRGKADLSKYRDAGKRVADVLQTFTSHLERASVDEAYLDITNLVDQRIQEKNDHITSEKVPNTFVVGNTIADFIENVSRHKVYDESNFKLALGAVIAEEIREEVFRVTGYKCSAGIAHNKILAKLVCGLHKPNKQTILPHEAVPQLYEKMPIKKIQSLGGKFGNTIVEKLNVEYMAELAKFTQKELANKFDEKSASFLYNIARGIDSEPVNTRLLSKSIGCCKKFPGKTMLRKKEDVEHWLKELAEEIFERLDKDFEENGRRARQMVVSFAQEIDDEERSSSKTHPLASYDQNKIFENAFKILQKNCLKDDGSYRVTFLGISVGNFHDVRKIREITSFFKNMKENSEKFPKTNPGKDTEKRVVDKIDLEPRTYSDEDASDNSIYSRTTEEGDINNEDLIYYHQIYPESVADHSVIHKSVEALEIDNGSDISYDSISNEINLENQENEIDVPPTTSFFNKYFNGSADRNFNTSKTLDDSDLSDSTPGINETADCEEPTNTKSDNSCPHCGKVIDDDADYQSHLDYHFAISIVKNEAHMYKSENKSQNGSSPIKNGQRKKKNKDFSNGSHKPIVDYFKMNSSATGQVVNDVCKECNKRVALSEWDIHVDYHAAKKLHLEMNVNRNKPIQPKNLKNKLKGQKNIIGFFKSC